MNARIILLGAVAALSLPTLLPAANIDRATITEVVNSVSVIDAGSKRSSPARTQQLFTAPNVLRTGTDSRAEMVAADSTVTRVGQNSLFSFEPNSRQVDLQKGSVLFQSPSGKGGGTIRTPAASAAVLGTTLIVTTTKDGGFKVLLIEGKGSVKTNTGKYAKLNAGQMVYALPGGDLSRTFEFRLSQQVAAARLLNSFKKPLPSAGKIAAATAKQEKEIAQGKAIATNLLATNSPNIAIQVDVARDAMKKQTVVVDDPAEAATRAAVSSDAIIDQPTLDGSRLFPNAIAGTRLAGQTFRADEDDSTTAFGLAVNPLFFVGNNVIFDTPTVDLSPYAGNDLVRFLAVNDLSFDQSVDLGQFPTGDLQFVAGHTIVNQPGTRVFTNAPNVSFLALGSQFPIDGNGVLTSEDFSPAVPLALNDFGVVNHGGSLLFLTGEAQFANVQLAAATNLNVAARRDITIRGDALDTLPQALNFVANGPYRPNFNAKQSGLASATQVRVAAGQDLDISATRIASPRTSLQGGRTVRLTAVRIDDGGPTLPSFHDSDSDPSSVNPGPRSLTISSRLLADLRAVNIVANNVKIEANTIRLEAVQFRDGSRVILESGLGFLAPNPNSNRPVRAGYVNFVRGVRYGNQPAEDAIIQNGAPPSSTSTSGSGIIVRKRGNN